MKPKVTYSLHQIVKVKGDQFEWIEIASDKNLDQLRDLIKEIKTKDPIAVLALWKKTEEELPIY